MRACTSACWNARPPQRRCSWRSWARRSNRDVAPQFGDVAGGLDVVLGVTLDNMAKPLRAVVGARVSHLDDEKESTRKVSHLAQTEEGERWAQARGYDVVGRFEDLGISAGKTTPFERPDLGKWLEPERLHEWQVIIFAIIDRAFRSTNDC